MGEWASTDDVAARYEGTIPTERTAWVDQLITDAEQLIRDEVPALDARIADGRTQVGTLRRVVVGMVLDVVRNPSGYSSQSAGEFSYSYAGATVSGGRLRLSAADRRAIAGRPRAMTLPGADPALDTLLRPDEGA